jgi:hypothetical protein
MHAIAAATFDGNPVDVDFGPGSGPGDGAGEGELGASSGMTYIHKMASALSSNLGFVVVFFAFVCVQAQYHALQQQ